MTKKTNGRDGRDRKEVTPSKTKARPGQLSPFKKAVIVVIIVVFAFSSVAGAVAAVMQSNREQSEPLTIEKVDERFEPDLIDMDKALERDPSDKDTLLKAGEACLSWGSYVRMLATVDAEVSHANEILERGVGYFDRLIAIEPSDEASMNRAMCKFYEGDTSNAIQALEQLTTDSPEYAPAWANLGMLYESANRADEARAAYQSAIDLDADDKAGARSYAQSRLDAMTAAEAKAQGQGGTGASGMSDDLADATGTGL